MPFFSCPTRAEKPYDSHKFIANSELVLGGAQSGRHLKWPRYKQNLNDFMIEGSVTLFRLAWRFLRTKKLLLAAIIFFQLGQILLSLWLPSLNATIIDRGILAGKHDVVWINGLIMLGVATVQVAFMVGAIYAGSRTAMEFGTDLRAHVFRAVQKFSPTDQHRFGAPTLITRTTNDVTQVQMVTLMTFTVMITAPIMGIGGIVMALRQDAQLSLLLLVIVPLLALIIAAVMAGLTPSYGVQQQRIDRINTLLREQLTGVRVIRAFVRQRSERKKFEQANSELRAIWLKIGWLWAFLMPATSLVVGISSAAVMWFGGERIQAGHMEVGSLTAYINYLMMILGSVMMSGMMAMMFPRGNVSAKRLQEIDNTIPSIHSPNTPSPLPSEPLTFELKHVTIQYEGAEDPVIRDADMCLSPGSLVAIIGSTGSGKSSIAKLFPRLLDPSSGQVMVSGLDARTLNLQQLRSRIAYVPQRAFLFSGTIASNVAGLPRMSSGDSPQERTGANQNAHCGKTHEDEAHYDEARIRLALEAAQAWDFVSDLNDGIHAAVESGGQNFSGGQRQRLAIARAIYRCIPDTRTGQRQADLLIFDDSFSALDFATDAALRTNLRRYVGDVAILLIAQRVSTIRNATEIVVLAAGGIEARGSHAELMKISPTYRDIVRSQLTEEEAR